MSVPISNVTRRVVFAPSGVGPYAFTFEILAATDIEVYKGDTLLTLTTDYTVTINTNGTGSVTLVLTAGTDNITIVGARAIERTTDFVTGGDFFANTVNSELDSLTIFAQQNAEAVTRSIQAPVTDPTTIDMTLPTKTDRAGKFLSFDADGDPATINAVVDVTTVAGIAANVTTVAGIAANVTTVAGVSADVTTVAGIAANVTTVAGIAANVTTVAGISADVTAVAGDAVDIGLVAAVSSDVAALGPIAADITAVAAIDTDVTTVAAVDTDVAALGPIAANITTVAGISADVTAVAGDATDIGTVAGIAADVTAVAAIDSDVTAVAGDATDIGTVATDLTGTNTIGTVAGIAADVATVAGISADVTAVAGDATDIGAVAAIDSDVTAVAGVAANVTTVAGIAANVTTVAGISSDVTTVATNVADITNFSDVYLGPAAADPTLRNDGSALQAGDLYFNTVSDVVKVYDGAAWVAAFASLSGALVAANNLSDLPDAEAARGNLGVEVDGATGAYQLSAGTEAERPGTPTAGLIRFNSDASSFEGYDGGAWGAIGGGVEYERKTANYTIAAGEGVIADTSGGVWTLTLPATPAEGDYVSIVDGASWGTNNLTVARNSSTIEGAAEDLTLDISGVAVQMVYDGTTWQVYSQVGGAGGTVVTEDGTQTLSNKTLAATTLSGTLSAADNLVNRPVLQDYAIEGSAIGNVGATRTFDLAVANFFSATVDQASTFTFSNPPASGDFGAFVMELTNGGAFVVTFPASVDFPGGTAPTLTAAGVDQLVFTTRDGGTTYFGFVAGLDIKSP